MCADPHIFTAQGKKTEATAVRKIVDAIRGATTVQLQISNYRADGSQFANWLMISPLCDSEGVYRYSVGCMVRDDATCRASQAESAHPHRPYATLRCVPSPPPAPSPSTSSSAE